jgi:hypothetical protein
VKVRFGEITFDGGRRALCHGPAALHVWGEHLDGVGRLTGRQFGM